MLFCKSYILMWNGFFENVQHTDTCTVPGFLGELGTVGND